MIKDKILIVIAGLTIILQSCNKKDSNVNNLIGVWQSSKVDSLIHYIIPKKDSVFHSGDFQNNTIEISNNGSFKLIEFKDTIFGKWIQYKNDSLKLTNNNPHGKYLYNSKVAFIDNNDLTISYKYGFASFSDGIFDDSVRIIENTINDIKIYYKRK
jgi:hypothetical protein